MAPVAVVLVLWSAAAVGEAGTAWPVIGGALVLAVVSWIEDTRGVAVGLRLATHLAAVAMGVAALPAGGVFQGLLPPLADAVAAALLWLWFVNLFNFMDGIDAMAGGEAVSVAVGLGLVALLAGRGWAPAYHAFVLGAAAAGFLIWNRPPARVFLGDVGSVPLGFLIGWLLLDAAAAGQWAAALILPGYFLGDATLTLARRLAGGEAVWRAHAAHFYQIAVRAGRSHGHVVGRVAALNCALIALALAATWADRAAAAALGIGALSVAGLLWYLQRPRGTATGEDGARES